MKYEEYDRDKEVKQEKQILKRFSEMSEKTRARLAYAAFIISIILLSISFACLILEPSIGFLFLLFGFGMGVKGLKSSNTGMVVIAIIMYVIGCILTFSSLGADARFDNFNEVEDDYIEIIDVLNTEYNNRKSTISEEFIVVNISNNSELSCDSQPIPLTDKQQESLRCIQEQSYVDYNFIWVSNAYIIFWEDETKQYGLLYSKRPRKIIRSMKKEWYSGMDYTRINKNWYEIGQFGL